MSINPGDTVEMHSAKMDGIWKGLRCVVIGDARECFVQLQPLADRPDGHGHHPFWWDRDELTVVEEADKATEKPEETPQEEPRFTIDEIRNAMKWYLTDEKVNEILKELLPRKRFRITGTVTLEVNEEVLEEYADLSDLIHDFHSDAEFDLKKEDL